MSLMVAASLAGDMPLVVAGMLMVGGVGGVRRSEGNGVKYGMVWCSSSPSVILSWVSAILDML